MENIKIKERVAQLLEKPMDRNEFLRFSGAGLLMLFGGSAIINALGLAQKHGKIATVGYGMGAYGGSNTTRSAVSAKSLKA